MFARTHPIVDIIFGQRCWPGILLTWLRLNVQERLWKRRAAYQLAQEAAAEGRRRLQAAQETAAAKQAEAGTKQSSRSSKVKKEDAADQQDVAESIAGEPYSQANFSTKIEQTAAQFTAGDIHTN